MNDKTKQLFQAAIDQTLGDLMRQPAEITAFAAERAAHLTLAAMEPGFAQAIEAEAHRVLLFAAGRAVRVGDATDARALGLIHGVLMAAAAG
jgi:hypothetical protein